MNKQRQETEPYISSQVLEIISRTIGDMDSGTRLQSFLIRCGVDASLIVYPMTKWLMVWGALSILNTSSDDKDRRALFTVIETACHPLMFGGDKKKAEETKDKFNALLDYDGSYVDEHGKLLVKCERGPDDCSDPYWIGKDGREIEPPTTLVIPQDIAKLYIFWRQLLRITRFYLINPQAFQMDDEIDGICHDIILAIEGVLEERHCGSLHQKYKRPFSNIVGLEFEIKKRGETTDDLLAYLHSFLADITDTYPQPYLDTFIPKVEEENKEFLERIERYIKRYKPKDISEEPAVTPTTKIEIIKLPPLEFKEPKTAKPPKKISLNSSPLVYDDDGPVLKLGSRSCPIPPFKNEHFFCRAMYEFSVGESVDWSVIYEKITGFYNEVFGKPPKTRENERLVYDAMEALNTRVKSILNTDNNLFTWQEKTVRRNF